MIDTATIDTATIDTATIDTATIDAAVIYAPGGGYLLRGRAPWNARSRMSDAQTAGRRSSRRGGKADARWSIALGVAAGLLLSSGCYASHGREDGAACGLGMCGAGQVCCPTCDGPGRCMASELCEPPVCEGDPCGPVTCALGEVCCPTCDRTGRCQPSGLACPDPTCPGVPCGDALCEIGEVCCPLCTGDLSCRPSCDSFDRCDRTDDDCDGFIDEDGFVVGTPQPVAPLDMFRFQPVSGDYDPMRGEVAIVFEGFDGDASSTYFVRLDPATAAPLGEVVEIGSSSAGSSVAFDGRHWTIAVAEASGGHLYRVDADTDVVTRVATFEPAGTALPSVARLGDLGVDVVVAWRADDPGPAGLSARLARYTLSGDAAAPATSLGLTESVSLPTDGFVHYAYAVPTRGGAIVAYLTTMSGLAPYRMFASVVGRTTTGPFVAWNDGYDASGLALAFEPSAGAIGLTFSSALTPDAPQLRTARADAMLDPIQAPLCGSFAPSSVATGEPGQLAGFSG
ncbi:MAG: hypothetical protein AB7P00_35565, partial [Sandaracinaceae bacterium]